MATYQKVKGFDLVTEINTVEVVGANGQPTQRAFAKTFTLEELTKGKADADAQAARYNTMLALITAGDEPAA